MKNEHPELEKSEVIKGLPKVCADETAAVEFFENQRWGDKPFCPHCQSENVYKMLDRDGTRNKRYLWRCRGCAEQFTVRFGSVFEDSRLPLKNWAYAYWRSSTSKKGVSAREIQRSCQISYKSALFLLHRVRFAVTNDAPTSPKLGGEGSPVEYDETYVGGKPRREKHGIRKPSTGFRSGSNKIPVVAMLERGGTVRTKVVPRVNFKNVRQFVKDTIDQSATVNTDGTPIYPSLFKAFARHDQVNHSNYEYARHNPDGTVSHVNTCESFFSLLKRGLMGTFHSVSREHLHRYCDEFAFRWDTRRFNDGQRVIEAIRRGFGKRLTYEDYVCRQ